MPSNDEELAVVSRRGKWSQPQVPHRRWRCVEVEDLGAPGPTCDMCESQAIRYVHYMEHDGYPDVLAVGCVCAGHMEASLERAQGRERMMVRRGRKRLRWLTRKWLSSAKGNEWLRSDGYRVVVYRKGFAWGVTVASEEDEDFVQHGRRIHVSSDAAKLAAFDFISRLLAQRTNAT